MRVVYSPRAIRDLEHIATYYRSVAESRRSNAEIRIATNTGLISTIIETDLRSQGNPVDMIL